MKKRSIKDIQKEKGDIARLSILSKLKTPFFLNSFVSIAKKQGMSEQDAFEFWDSLIKSGDIVVFKVLGLSSAGEYIVAYCTKEYKANEGG